MNTKEEISNTLNQYYDRQALIHAGEIVAGLGELLRMNWKRLCLIAGFTALAFTTGCKLYSVQDQDPSQAPATETQGGKVTLVSPTTPVSITPEASGTPPPPEALPTQTGAILSARGGGEGGSFVSLDRLPLPSNLPQDLIDQNKIVSQPGEGIGDKACVEAGLCFFIPGAYPEGFIGPDGNTYIYDPVRASLLQVPVYTTSNGGSELVQVPVKIPEGHQVMMGVDAKGQLVYLDVAPDGTWKVLDVEALHKSPAGSQPQFSWADGTVHFSDGTVASMVERDIIPAHPQNSAECDQICPKITLDNLSRIQVDRTPLTPNENGTSGIVISQGTNTEVHINSGNSEYLGAINLEFPDNPGVTGVLAAIKTVNTDRSDQKSVIVYLLKLVDGTLQHTTADADQMLQKLNSGNFDITAVSKYYYAGNGTKWFDVAKEITDGQDLGLDPRNPSNYDGKIVIN